MGVSLDRVSNVISGLRASDAARVRPMSTVCFRRRNRIGRHLTVAFFVQGGPPRRGQCATCQSRRRGGAGRTAIDAWRPQRTHGGVAARD